MKRVRFSVLDAGIIVIAVVAVAALVWFFNFRGAGGEPVWVNFTFEARDVWHEFYGPQIGDTVFDSVRGHYLGVVTGVEFRPATMFTEDTINGLFLEQDIPNQIDVLISVRAPGYENDDRIIIAGDNFEIRVGTEMFLKGKGYAGEGFAVALSTESR